MFMLRDLIANSMLDNLFLSDEEIPTGQSKKLWYAQRWDTG